MISADTVTVETIATRIAAVPHGGSAVFIGVGAGETIYLGGSAVTVADGFILAGPATITLDDVTPEDEIYGIAAGNTVINVLVRTPGQTEPEFGVAP